MTMDNKQSSTGREVDASRRRLLTQAAAGAAALAPITVLVAAATSEPAGQPETPRRRWGLLIDSAKCVNGCDDCVQACNQEHGLGELKSPETDAQWVRKVGLRDKRTGHLSSLPMLCQHCEHPPCVDVCPTGASFKRSDGIVLVDKHICIGCRYCMMACPFKARSFVHEDLHDQLPAAPRGKGTVEGCTMCMHRVDEDGAKAETACQQACGEAGHGAIVFGDLNDPDSRISTTLKEYPSIVLRADLELNQGVRYRNV